MFWDFGQPKTFVSRKKDFVSRKKHFCITQKVFVSHPKNFVSQNKHHFRGTLYSKKSILYLPKKWHPTRVCVASTFWTYNALGWSSCSAHRRGRIFFNRTVSPTLSHAFTGQHDAQIWSCFCTLVGVDPGAINGV